MNVHLFVGVPDSVKPIGQATVGHEVIEIDLQDLIRLGVEAASRHVGESVKLFLLFNKGDDNEEFDVDTYNFLANV